MHGDTILLMTFVFALVAAFAGGVVARALRLPPIVGYLVGGLVVSPFTPGFIGDSDAMNQLSEVGVMFMMFSTGLHFSLTDSASLGMSQGTILINGPKGAVGIDKISTFVLGVVVVLITVAVVLNLMHSRDGRAIMAVRDNRIAAESVGINTTKYRLIAFTVAAALAGMAGVLYAMNYSTVIPSQFDFNQSILILVYVVLGGMGNISGSIISAAFLTVLPEVLRPINNYRMLIYAVVLILVMVVPHTKIYQRIADALRRRFRKGDFDDAPVAEAVAEEGGEAHE